ncbi:KWG Leptospira [Candidatus Izimaplasma bacterium HR1]|jgi:hypothetical protein|uniref:WG repeat-containing protein n=1 Tax=Candidatus Izimoplasma sp. HR1 TaxID=1541959 RepID=UPI0004F5B4CB|nr:KWG Leptospira [Candidatus Izimaplasma bacterium HR1]
MKKLLIVVMFFIVVLVSGCTGNTDFSITGNENIQVEVGSALPNLLEGVAIEGEVTEQLLKVDTSSVNMNIIGDYNIVFYIELDEERIYEETIVLSVVESVTVANPHPVILGAVNITYILGEEIPDLLEGIRVEDPKFGDITPALTIDDSEIVYDTFGVYEIEYTASNADGYYASITKTVEVTGGDIFALPDDFYIVSANNMYGIVDEDQNVIVPLEYDDIFYFGAGIVRLQKDGMFFFYNSETNQYFQSEYTINMYGDNGLAIASNGTKYGYVDTNGEVVIDFQFSSGSLFMDGIAFVSYGTFSQGIINEQGETLLPLIHRQISFLDNGYVKTMINDGTYIYDDEYNLVFECESIIGDSYMINDDEYYIFSENQKQGVLDNEFNIIIEAEYETVTVEEELLFLVVNSLNTVIHNIENETTIVNSTYHEFEDFGLFVCTDGDCGLYDKMTLELIIEQEYVFIGELNDDLLIVQNSEDELGIVDNLGNEVIPCIYESIYLPAIGRMSLYKDEEYFLADYDGNMLTGAYTYIFTYNSLGHAMVENTSGFYGLIDMDGVEILPAVYSTLEYNNNGFYYTRDSSVPNASNMGVLDSNFNVVIPNHYYQIYFYSEGIFSAKLDYSDDTSSGYVDTTNTVVVPMIYEEVSSMNEGYGVVKLGAGRYLYVDAFGNILPTPEFYSASVFRDGYARVQLTSNANSKGVIDTTGSTIVSCVYKSVTDIQGGFFVVVFSDNTRNYVDLNDNLLLAENVDNAGNFIYGVAVINDDGVESLINSSGEIIIEDKSAISIFEDSIYVIGLDIDYYYYGFDGELLFRQSFYQTIPFIDGYALVWTGTLESGFININGDAILPITYNYLINLGDTHYLVSKDGYNVAIVNEEGILTRYFYDDDEEVISYLEYGLNLKLYDSLDNLLGTYEYDDIVAHTAEGNYLFEVDGKYILIDSEGEPLFDETYDHIYIVGDGYIIVKNDLKCGLIDPFGELIMPLQYDILSVDIDNGIIFAINGGYYGIYDIEGNEIIPNIYDYIQYVVK